MYEHVYEYKRYRMCACLQTLGVDVRMIDSDDVNTALSRQQCQKVAEESAWAGDETDNLIGGEMLLSICLALVLSVTHLYCLIHLYITPVTPVCHLTYLCHPCYKCESLVTNVL
jgi:hypothetical protein